MKMKRKIFISLIVMTIFFNYIINTICAIGFDPTPSKDDETYKEYTAKLNDIQFNTAMALSPFSLDLDNELDPSSVPLLLIGSVQVNHIKDSKVEFLEEDPVLKLVDENNQEVGITELYRFGDTDTYYFDIYDLEVENDMQYKLLISITDNYDNTIEKYVTYSDSLFISEHLRGNMTLKSVNNIAVIEFNIDEEKTIKGDLNGDNLVDSADAAIALNLYKYNNATEEEIATGDMDGNGIIDSADAAIILNTYKYGI